MFDISKVMAIGRTFEESFQKAMRMTHPSIDGFTSKLPAGKQYAPDFDLTNNIKTPNNTRVHSIAKVSHHALDNRLDLCVIYYALRIYLHDNFDSGTE